MWILTDGKPDLFIDVDHDFLPDVNIDTDKDGRPDINIDTDGDLEPDVNIDTDGTDTWYPSSRGGNADKIWKPYKNIDTGDGEGPIHTDTTAAVDEDHNGVDDRWKPEHNTAAANGFEYDTMAADWLMTATCRRIPAPKIPVLRIRTTAPIPASLTRVTSRTRMTRAISRTTTRERRSWLRRAMTCYPAWLSRA